MGPALITVWASCHKVPQARWLKTTEVGGFTHSSRSQKSAIKVSARLGSLRKLQGWVCPGLFQLFWSLLGILGILRLAAASLPAFPITGPPPSSASKSL